MKQTVKVPLADLISFRNNSSHIKDTGTLPILGYIKFDNGKIIKNNLKDFIVQDSKFEGVFLVEERALFNYIKTAKASDVLFTIEGKKITISNGSRPATCTTEDHTPFPMPNIQDSDKIEIPKDVLDAIATAASYASGEPQNQYHPIMPNVFVGNKGVGASDGLIAYYEKFGSDLPEIILEKNQARVVGGLMEDRLITFSSNEKFNIFFSEGVTYGFIKPEAKFFDIGTFFVYKPENTFTVSKSAFLDFNETCVAFSPSKTIYPEFSVENGILSLSMIDKDYSLDVREKIDCIGNMDGSFKYIATEMSNLLKTAPDEELTLHQTPGKMYITGESGFSALIIQISEA